MENVPEKGAAILASNHLSFADHTFMPLVLKRKVVFLAKAEYFTGKGVKEPSRSPVSSVCSWWWKSSAQTASQPYKRREEVP